MKSSRLRVRDWQRVARPAPEPRVVKPRRPVTREVCWSLAAELDLLHIVDYIAADSSLIAGTVLDKLQAQATRLDRHAERGRRIPELRAWKAASAWRESIVPPWRMIYAIDGDSVIVLALVDARRDFRMWLAGRSAVDLSRID
jgi:toxin ParE1/3/4